MAVTQNGDTVNYLQGTDLRTAQMVVTRSGGDLPAGATALSASSGNVAAASAVATLTGAASVTTYISGIQITSSGSTAAAVVTGTITGLLGGTASFTYTTVAGATLANAPLTMQFVPPLPASAANTSIVVTLPSLGAGNTNATVMAQGYRL